MEQDFICNRCIYDSSTPGIYFDEQGICSYCRQVEQLETSGGTDSSFLLLKAVEWGLRPLAVHYDNTWNSAIATENIRKVTTKLNIDLYT